MKLSDNEFIRSFDKKDSEDFVWHRDREDREIKIISGKDWKIQFENKLPETLEKDKTYFIPKILGTE